MTGWRAMEFAQAGGNTDRKDYQAHERQELDESEEEADARAIEQRVARIVRVGRRRLEKSAPHIEQAETRWDGFQNGRAGFIQLA